MLRVRSRSFGAIAVGLAEKIEPRGLSEEEASNLLREVGPNSFTEEKPTFWHRLIAKFSLPIAWMLEGAKVMQLAWDPGSKPQ
jgi:magnesium-transporting ATPase (P-type)